MRLHHRIRTLAAVLTAAAISAPAAYGKYADAGDPAQTAAGHPTGASQALHPNPDSQATGSTPAQHPSEGSTDWALIGVTTAGGIALIGSAAAASRRVTRRSSRIRAAKES